MNKINHVSFLIGLLLAGCSHAMPGPNEPDGTMKSHDGRFESKCWFQVGDKAVCKVTIEQLLSNPEKYQNKAVSFFGYVAINSGDLMVYPDENHYKYQVNESAIGFKIPYDTEVSLAEKFHGRYAVVTGNFKGDIYSPDQLRAGIIEGNVDIAISDLRPPLPEHEKIMLKTGQIEGHGPD